MILNKLPETDLKLSEFWYDLPEEFIAQTPVEPRDSSKLLILDRATETTEHRIFRDITEYIRPEDVLVINETRVIPARIIGKRVKRYDNDTRVLVDSESDSAVEVLLLKQTDNTRWEALTGPGKRAKPHDILSFDDGNLTAEVESISTDGCRIVNFSVTDKFKTIYEAFEHVGSMPLPPYIKSELKDQERYQTVYSRDLGSSAAPTAGLHFTKELLEKIKESGTAVAKVTLHVGLGTFRPVKEENIADHKMHAEYIHVTDETAALINERRAKGGRIIAVGTTSCRTLESVSDDDGIVHPYSGDTGIFIYPGYRFKATDALITNFHLPESTLLMLVSAFSNREFILRAYEEAKEKRYRFFSFGDAMMII